MARKMMPLLLRTIAMLLYVATGLCCVSLVVVITYWFRQEPLWSLSVPAQEPVTVILGLIIPVLYTTANHVNAIASRDSKPANLLPVLAASAIVIVLLSITVAVFKETPEDITTEPPQIDDLMGSAPSEPARDAQGGKVSPIPSIDQPSVGSSAIIVKTRAGHEVYVTSLALGIYVHPENPFELYDRFLGFSAIPLDSGIRVSFEYIRSVRLEGSAKDLGPVEITLTDGSVMHGNLGGVEEVHPGMAVIGRTAHGEFQAEIADLQELTFRRPEKEMTLPQALPAGPIATIYNRNGTAIRISNPTLEFIRRIPGNTVSCEVLSGDTVRTEEGFVIGFEKIREIQIINNGEKHVNPIPVELIYVDGQRLKTALVAVGGSLDPTAEPCYGWRLKGKVEIGDFALGLSFIERIVFE